MLMKLYENDPLVNIIVFGTINNCDVKIGENSFYSDVASLNCNKRLFTLNQKEFYQKITHIFHNTHRSFEYSARGMWKILEVIQRKNPKIHLISTGSYIATIMDCATLINKQGTFDACKARRLVTYFNPDEKIKSKIPETKTLNYLYINKYELLCKENKLENCLTHVGNEPMFYDQNHLSYEFSRYLGKLIGSHYREALINIGLPPPITEIH